MKKAAVPTLATPDATLGAFASAVKQNLDAITGQARGAKKLAPLPSTATLAQVVARLNELLERLQ